MAVEYRVKGRKKDRVVSSRDQDYDWSHVVAAQPTEPEARARVDALFRDRRSP